MDGQGDPLGSWPMSSTVLHRRSPVPSDDAVAGPFAKPAGVPDALEGIPAPVPIVRGPDDLQVDPPMTDDAVNHPSHYGGDTTYETIKVIEAWELGFSLGNAVKYISRAGRKDAATELEDLKKARWYIERRIRIVEQHER